MNLTAFDNLTDENVLLYAIKAYERPTCILSEFEADFKRIKYIKRLIRRYRATGDLKERNILNHIIVFYNVFGIPAATRLLFFKLDTKDYDVLKTFLTALNYMPKIVEGIKGSDISNSEIPLHNDVLTKLTKVTGYGSSTSSG